jgi:hypothetical protein
MGAIKDHLMDLYLDKEEERERGTIIFALELYAQLLEKEKDYEARNKVFELIWRLDK